MYIFNLAGAQFRPVECQAETITSVRGTELILEREPKNPYDTSAIRVLSARTNAHLGYVPRHIAYELAPKIDAGEDFACFVKYNNGTKKPELMVDRRDSHVWWTLSVEEVRLRDRFPPNEHPMAEWPEAPDAA
jgi:hypothetical protein